MLRYVTQHVFNFLKHFAECTHLLIMANMFEVVIAVGKTLTMSYVVEFSW